MQQIITKFLAASFLMAGLFVTSCKPEPKPEEETVNAVVEITVAAFDTDSDKDVSTDSALKITASSSAGSSVSVNGNVIKLEGSPAINQQTVAINAAFNGKNASTSVQVNALSAGGKATYNANVVFEGTKPDPGHEEGHDHDHGHGNENAGGGIVDFD